MKKLFLILLIASPAFAGKANKFSDPKLNDEFDTNYYEHVYPNWVNARGSVATISTITATTHVQIKNQSSTPNKNGLLHVGESDTSDNQDPAILISRVVSSTNTPNYAHGIQDFTLYTNDSYAYGSVQAYPTIKGNIHHYYAYNSVPVISVATMTFVIGSAVQPTILQSSVTAVYGHSVGNAIKDTSYVGEQYGYQTDALTAGATNWAFYATYPTHSYFPKLVIGTSPNQVISFGGTTHLVNLNGDGATANSIVLHAQWSTAGSSPSQYILAHSKSNTVGTHTALASGDRTGHIGFTGSDGTQFVNSMYLTGEVDGAVSTSIVPGRLKIRTANQSGVLTDAVVVNSSQGVVLSNYIQPLSQTSAQIKARTPDGGAGQYYYCSDCATVTTCVSTGTARGAYALITARTSACQ